MVGLGGLEPPTSPLSGLRSLVPREKSTLTVQLFRLPCNYPASPRSPRRRHAPHAGAVLAIADYLARRARDCANRQVLLVADILVGGDEHIKSGGLGGF